MSANSLEFHLPPARAAIQTPEDRGSHRDAVRLLVSRPSGDSHHRFSELPELLRAGDLLVVNESSTLPASVPGRADFGAFRVSISTAYVPDLWLVEPRWDFDKPGPLPLAPGDRLTLADVPARYISDYPGIPRLGFVHLAGDLRKAMQDLGSPIRYGYLSQGYPLDEYQTVFGRIPGSAEMPSAGRPFTPRVVRHLELAGVAIAPIVLHTGVSSLEPGDAQDGSAPVFPEPFGVPASTVEAIRRTRAQGGRVIAVGTSVVRALESATDGCGLRAARGFTRVYLNPKRPARNLDGLVTGFHEGGSTHLALLAAVAGEERIRRAYQAAIESGYLWHEFGDSHLILLR